MKITLAAIILLIITAVSCKKNTTAPNPKISPIDTLISPVDTSDTVRILGRWSIVTDSLFINYQFSPDTVEVYTGTPADYYDFLANGNLYIRENNRLDTLQYLFTSGGPLQPISTTTSTGEIISLTDSSMELYLSHSGGTAEIHESQVINFKK